jgi:hypothetical protein
MIGTIFVSFDRLTLEINHWYQKTLTVMDVKA